MSKDFEQAYKESAQMEAPDLWDRIEAGLKSKSVPEKEVIQEKETEKRKKTYNLKRYFRRYSGVIAAAVCVAVIIPAAILIRQTSKGYSGSGAAEGIDNSAMEVADGNMASAEGVGSEQDGRADTGAGQSAPMDEEAGEDIEMSMVTEEKSESARAAFPADMGAMEESADDFEKQPAKESAVEENRGNTANDAGDMMADTVAEAEKKRQEGSSQSGQNSESEKTAGLEDGTVIEHVVIRVTELKEDFGKESEDGSGILCTAVIQKIISDSQQSLSDLQQNVPALRGEEPFLIYASLNAGAPLYEGGVFEVDLEYQSGEDYSFILRKYRREIK